MYQKPTPSQRRVLKVVQNGLGVGVLLLTIAIGQSKASSAPKDSEPTHFSASAQTALVPSTEPFNLAQLQNGVCSSSVKGVTESSISQTHLTIPSFWWLRDEIAAQAEFGRRLIDGWLACPEQNSQWNRVDFLVNQQVWSLLDYLERYEFVHRLGTVASDYRYNVRVFDRQGALLASYTCAFDSNVASATKELLDKPANPSQAQAPPQPPALSCSLALDPSGNSGFQQRIKPDGSLPTGSGIVQP
jgi:hypothetical protein